MSLEMFFNPGSVAIVGASQTAGKVGYEVLANMIVAGFKTGIENYGVSHNVVSTYKATVNNKSFI